MIAGDADCTPRRRFARWPITEILGRPDKPGDDEEGSGSDLPDPDPDLILRYLTDIHGSDRQSSA